MSQPTMQPNTQGEATVKAIAQEIYPGRSWDELSEEEKKAVLMSGKAKQALGNSLMDVGASLMGQGLVRAGNVAVSNPWNAVAGGLAYGLGVGSQMKGAKEEGLGRSTSADLITRRDYLDKLKEEEERKRLAAMWGASV